MGNTGRELPESGQAIGLHQLLLGRLELLRALIYFAFERRLHIIQFADSDLEALSHSIEGVHQFVDFLAAPRCANCDGAVQFHLADRLSSRDQLPDRSRHETLGE